MQVLNISKCLSIDWFSRSRVAHVRADLSQMHSHAPIILLTPDQLTPSMMIMTCNQMRMIPTPTHKNTRSLSLHLSLPNLFHLCLSLLNIVCVVYEIDLVYFHIMRFSYRPEWSWKHFSSRWMLPITLSSGESLVFKIVYIMCLGH